MSRRLCSTVAAAGMLLAAVLPAAADQSPLPDADYGVSTIWQLGGIGGWITSHWNRAAHAYS